MSIESQRAEAALPESQEDDRAVAEAATDAIITIDSDSTILIVNPAAESIFGYSTAEMIGQPLTMLMPDYLRHLHKAGITRYLETGRKHIEWSTVQLAGLHKTGNEIPLEISFAEFNKEGRRFFTGIARDISERKRLQERQARLARHAVLHAEVSLFVDEVAVFNVAGNFCATQGKCTHRQGPLSEGKLDGSTVTCPKHGAQFDVYTGEVWRGPAQDPLTTYKVIVDVGLQRSQLPKLAGGIK